MFPYIVALLGLHCSGRLTCGATPIADWNSKLYMPKYLYPGRVYPGYLSGTGYMIRGSIVPTLLRNAQKTPLIHLEDIYVTALLGRQSRIYPDDSSYFTYSHIDPKDKCAFRFMVSATIFCMFSSHSIQDRIQHSCMHHPSIISSWLFQLPLWLR